MKKGEFEPFPRVPDRDLEKHGISIPAPTPTSVSVPNPWKPIQSANGANGNGISGAAQVTSKVAASD